MRLTRAPWVADNHYAERPLLLREFIQGIVALAAASHPQQPALPQKLRALLSQDILPRACPKPSEQEAAAGGATPGGGEPDPARVAAVEALRPRLRYAYHYYAVQGAADAPRVRRKTPDATLPVRGLLRMLADAQMLPLGCDVPALLRLILPACYTPVLRAAAARAAAAAAEAPPAAAAAPAVSPSASAAALAFSSTAPPLVEEDVDEEEALGDALEVELIYGEFEEVVCSLAAHYFTEPRPWEPTPPAPAEVEGEEAAEGEAAAPSKDAPPEAEGEEAAAAAPAAEAPAEEEGDPVTRLVDGVLLPNLANHVAARLAELASSA